MSVAHFGNGSDGSLGLKAIEEINGIAFVQYPDTAQLEGMQRSALESVIPDIVAPAGELPANLIASPKFMPTHMADKSGESKNKSDVEKFIVLLREQNGHGFSLYKKNTLFRLIGNTETMQGMNMVKYTTYRLFLNMKSCPMEPINTSPRIGKRN